MQWGIADMYTGVSLASEETARWAVAKEPARVVVHRENDGDDWTDDQGRVVCVR